MLDKMSSSEVLGTNGMYERVVHRELQVRLWRSLGSAFSQYIVQLAGAAENTSTPNACICACCDCVILCSDVVESCGVQDGKARLREQQMAFVRMGL